MDSLESLSKIAIIATPIFITIGFLFAYRQIISNRNTRMAQVILSITTRWDNLEMRESRALINRLGKDLEQSIKTAQTNSSEELYTLLIVADFFDVLGSLVVEGLLDSKIAYGLYCVAEEHYYKLYRSAIDEHKFTNSYEYFERLHNAFSKVAGHRSKEKTKVAF